MERRRALVDRHHAGLLNSLQLLLEDRLGYDVYVPVGQEWWEDGTWRFGESYWGDDRLARQFLTEDGWERDGLNLVSDGDWYATDPEFPDRWVAGVSRDRARELDFHLVVSTLPDNYAGYAAFAGTKRAKFAIQVGNAGQEVRWEAEPDLVMDSTRTHGHEWVPVVQYHQEWDKDGLFMFTEPRDPEFLAASFVNCMPSMGQGWKYLRAVEAEVGPIAVHGIDGPAGNLKPIGSIAARMKASRFGYHDKHGDGFGHVVHYWASVGRPLIGKADTYAGRLASDLWEDGATCINTARRRPHETAREVVALLGDTDRYLAMCREIRARVDARVDFAAEASEMAAVLGVESTL